LLVNVGLNDGGIGVVIDSVYATDGRVGVPRILSARAVLNARVIGGAIRACVPKLRAGGYGYLVADDHGGLYCVKTSATTHALLYGEDGWLAHTNHHIIAKMQSIEEAGTYSGSPVRLNRARRLLQRQLGEVTVEGLQAILRGEIPDAVDIPVGCRFHPRCPVAVDACRDSDPALRQVAARHAVACLLV
jgi:oligopeptide/dipeptide ABC transporter ATP-binding protein